MSQEQPMQDRALAGQQIRVRLDQMKRAPTLNAIGLPELIGLATAVVLALITVFAYFYFLVPAQSRRTSIQLDRDRMQGQTRSSETNLKEDSDTGARVRKITASLEDFEGNWLAAADSGRMTLYTELNNLISSNGLRNTSGPGYSPLEPFGSKNQVQPSATAQQQTTAKWQTIYPGIAVSVTVEGPYQNVRHFVRDIEASRQFLVINGVELEGASQSAALQNSLAMPAPAVGLRPAASPPRGARPLPVSPQAPPRPGTYVSLRLDMATYFRRPETDKGTTP
jgi:hypothetical protein